MKASCATCTYKIDQVYKGKRLPMGTCIHLAFFKAGIGKVVDGKFQLEYRLHRDRLSAEVVGALQADDKFWIDVLDIRNFFRICPHYTSPFAFAKIVMDYYQDTWENYPWAVETFLNWAKAGFPMTEKTLEKFRVFHIFEYKIKDVNPEFYKDYNMCVMCHHWEQELMCDGAPRPFKGFCNEGCVSEGLFSLAQTERKNTYSFLSCPKFLVNSMWTKKQLQEDATPVSSKVFPFIETNEANLTIPQFEGIFHFPHVNKPTLIDPLEHKRITTMDLTQFIKDKAQGVQLLKFYTDMGYSAVQKFFTKRMAMSSKEKTEFWNKFKFYDQADKDLYTKK